MSNLQRRRQRNRDRSTAGPTTAAPREGLTADGKLRPGYRYAKGGAIVKAKS